MGAGRTLVAGRQEPGLAHALAVLAACCLLCQALSAQICDDAAGLRQMYQSLLPRLDQSPFQRQLYLHSEESSSTVRGEIYAVLNYPFTTVNDTLNAKAQGPKNWCDVRILHPNIKYCLASGGSNGSNESNGNTLAVNVSQKEVTEDLRSTYRVQFDYNSAISSPGYFQVRLHADSGPLGTRDYRIVLEAMSLDGKHTFLHLTYAYSYGSIGRVAMKGYLATFGAGKVGFTNIADPPTATPKYIDGLRGLVERNTMRYYLAIDAYLSVSALSGLPGTRLEQRLNNWFSASEQYPRQLHEIGREQYMQMKQEEYRRQQAMQ